MSIETNVEELEDRVIAEKFQLRECVGLGASGAVYKADQIALGRTVAVKILAPELAADPRLVKRFHDEALAASRLNHPNTVAVIDYGQTHDGLLYLVMEFLRGKTLTQVVQQEFPLRTNTIADITVQVLSGLEEAHHAGVVHADLKCDNIVVEHRRGNWELAKVVDFGIARIVGAPRDESERTISGTPEYMAPEIIRGSQPTFASDLYAVGVVLYELLTGRTPFAGGNSMEILGRHLRQKAVPPWKLSLEHEISRPLAEAAMRAMAKKPSDRFANAAAFRQCILDAAKGRTHTEEQVLCDGCGVLSEAAFKFCPECGRPRRGSRHSSSAEIELSKTVELSQSLVEQSTEDGLFPLPMVGRQRELDALAELCAKGTSGMLQLVGPRGSGRSRLIRATCRRVALSGNGMSVYLATPDPTGLGAPFYPVRSLIAALLELPPICTYEGLSNAVRELGLSSRDLPGIAELFSLDGELSQVEPPVRRRELLASTTRTLHAATNRGPTLLIFEDVDQYDGPSQELLRRLSESREETDLRVIVTNSPEFAARWPASMQRIDLEELPDQALAELAEHLHKHVPEGMPDAAQLAEHTGGNPAHVQQLARYIVEGGSLDQARGSLPDLIGARVNLLPQGARVLLQGVAVFGQEVARDVLDDAMDSQLDAEELNISLALLRARGFVVADDEVVRFESSLIRDITYDSTPADVRRGLHAAAAVALQVLLPGPLVSGHHLEMAGELERAAELLALAGDNSVHQFDDAGAARIFQRALAATRQLLLATYESDVRVRFVSLSVKLAEALRISGEVSLARGVIAEAWSYCDDAPSLRAQLLRASAHLALIAGNDDAAVSSTREAIGLTIPTGKTELLAELYIDLSSMLLRGGNSAQALQELEEGLDLITLGEGARAEFGPDALWRLLLRLAQLYSSLDDRARAVSIARHATEHARRTGSRVGLARAQSMLAAEFEKMGNETQAAAYRQAAVEEMRRLGDRRGTAELLLAGTAPTRSLVRITSSTLREAERLAKEVGWSEGIERARSSS